MPETPPQPEARAEPKANRGLTLVGLAGFFFGIAATATVDVLHEHQWFTGLLLLNIWGAFLAGIHLVYWASAQPEGAVSRTYRRVVQFILTALGAVGILTALYFSFGTSDLVPPTIEPGKNALLATSLFLAVGVIQRFLAGYLRRALGLTANSGPLPLLSLLQTSSLLLLLAALGAYLLPYIPQAVFWFFAFCKLVIALVAIEALLKSTFIFYQPAGRRASAGPAGQSSLLVAIFGSPAEGRTLRGELEALVGMRLEEIWAVRFLSRALVPALVVSILAAWLTTCFTMVPLGTRGVKVSFGEFRQDILEPGLHLTAPWPFERIEVVNTELQRQIILGMERDLGGPVLWTRKHYEGEKHMLLAEGEELLTFSMPIVYTISDPRAFLMSTMDADQALQNLAYRQLLLHISGRDSFDVMTAQREELTTSLHREIQADINRMNLGLDISFLGFKDVHPPVEVTDSYQMVISAQEERNAMIDQARAYRAERLPLAQQEAARLHREADAAALARIAAGTGTANRFTYLQEAQSEAPELFRFRRRMETLDGLLPGRRTIVVDEEVSDYTDLYLDMNEF